jgi:hypothetical protein
VGSDTKPRGKQPHPVALRQARTAQPDTTVTKVRGSKPPPLLLLSRCTTVDTCALLLAPTRKPTQLQLTPPNSVARKYATARPMQMAYICRGSFGEDGDNDDDERADHASSAPCSAMNAKLVHAPAPHIIVSVLLLRGKRACSRVARTHETILKERRQPHSLSTRTACYDPACQSSKPCAAEVEDGRGDVTPANVHARN